MKNPLNKRIFSEIKCDKGRYIAIFLFLILAIGFISGFIIADSSMIEEVNKSDEKYNIENGNFEIYGEVTPEIQKIADDEQISLYKNFYIEEAVLKKNQTESTSRLRIFKNREEVNTVCVMKGNLPEGKDEIAIDRMYADNNELKVGDIITVGNYEYKITGLVALPDYLALLAEITMRLYTMIIHGNTVTSLRMRNRKKNGQIISHLNSVKQPLLQSTFQSIPIRRLCSQEMIWVETRCL